MDIFTIFENIPPAFYGIILGSMLTIIGVVLTNVSTTKRLHIQHEYERQVRNKERDLKMRQEVYMDVMEAISAGLVAVSRFSEPNQTPEKLMQSYTDLSPKVGKVSIVGQSETIKAFATFNLELTGAFLRLSAKREQINALLNHSQQLDKAINSVKNDIAALATQKSSRNADDSVCQKERVELENQLEEFQSELDAVDNQLMGSQIKLVQDCTAEVAILDQLLVPLIDLLRSELELPFDAEFYAQILRNGHEKQKEYLAAFFDNFPSESL